MSTLSHPSPLAPRHFPFPKLRRPRRHAAAPVTAPVAGEQAPVPGLYTRSALPLAVTWFLLPAVLLVLSVHFGWTV